MIRPRLELRTFCVLDRCDNQLRHRTDNNEWWLTNYKQKQAQAHWQYLAIKSRREMASKSTPRREVVNLQACLVALTAVRLWISLTDLSNTLKHDHQLSSPLTSFSQCSELVITVASMQLTNRLVVQEGIYLFKHDIDPYSGGSFRHVSPPIGHFLGLITFI